MDVLWFAFGAALGIAWHLIRPIRLTVLYRLGGDDYIALPATTTRLALHRQQHDDDPL